MRMTTSREIELETALEQILETGKYPTIDILPRRKHCKAKLPLRGSETVCNMNYDSLLHALAHNYLKLYEWLGVIEEGKGYTPYWRDSADLNWDDDSDYDDDDADYVLQFDF